MRTLTPREVEFLTQSNLIENISNIDYRDPRNADPDAGHVGAFVRSQARAAEKAPLTTEELCMWQRLIAQEQLRFGHELPREGVGVLRGPACPLNVRVGGHIAPHYEQVGALTADLLRELNSTLQTRRPSIVEFAAALGDSFQRFEAIHPFVDGNGRTGRLLANYIVTHAGQPIIVFRVEERPEYYAAHASKMAMRRFMANKLRDAVFGPGGELYLRTVTYGATDSCMNAAGEVLLVENHDLVDAVKRWAE